MNSKNNAFKRFLYSSKRDRWLFFMLAIPVVHVLIFSYIPMYGILISFKDYNVFEGFLGSKWVGFDNYDQVFNDPDFWKVFINTIRLGVITMLFSFPAPIILALLLNELRSEKFKRTVQLVTYLPHFIAVTVVAGMVISMLSPSTGIINLILEKITGKTIYFMTEPNWFIPIFVSSEIWVATGFGAIIYLAALTGIDVVLYESADMDGATRWQKVIHITLPSIMPTIVVMMILSMPAIVNVNFEKVLLLYNPLTYSVADVIPTYVYRKGLLGGQYSYGTAVSFFLTVFAFILTVIANSVSKRASKTSLW